MVPPAAGEAACVHKELVLASPTFAAVYAAVAAAGSRHVVAAVAAAVVRAAVAAGPTAAVGTEVMARLALVAPALMEREAAGASSRQPRVPGSTRALRNCALHVGMGQGLASLPTTGNEAKHMQPPGRQV